MNFFESSQPCFCGESFFHYIDRMAKPFGLPKTEKLKSRKQTDALFAGGKGFSVFPLRVMYSFAEAPEAPGVQIGVSASKRLYKKAVHRNRIKRLLREAYRLQKEELLQTVKASNKRGIIFFLFTDKTLPSFEAVKAAMAKSLKKLSTLANRENPA